MNNMKFIEVLKNKKYGMIATVSAIAMVIIYPYTQVALNGGFYNYFFWFEVLLMESILNTIFYITFSILFGVVISLSLYNWQHKTCSVKGSVSSGGFASVLGIATSQCSACLSLASLFLPISAVGLLTQFNWVFNIISIGILLFSIRLMGGFKRE